MPAFQFNEQPLICGTDMDFEFALYDEDEAPVALSAPDVVSAVLSQLQGGTATLVITSDDELDGGSTIEIEELGSVGNPDPDDDVPASGVIKFRRADTEEIPDDDEWAAAMQEKLYFLLLKVAYQATDLVKPAGRGRLRLSRTAS